MRVVVRLEKLEALRVARAAPVIAHGEEADADRTTLPSACDRCKLRFARFLIILSSRGIHEVALLVS